MRWKRRHIRNESEREINYNEKYGQEAVQSIFPSHVKYSLPPRKKSHLDLVLNLRSLASQASLLSISGLKKVSCFVWIPLLLTGKEGNINMRLPPCLHGNQEISSSSPR